MSTTALISGRGRSPQGLDRVAKQVDARCDVVDYREPSGERRWWIEAPNLGAPFDGQMRAAISAAAKAARIPGFADDDDAATKRATRGHVHRPKTSDERAYMGEIVTGPCVEAARGDRVIRDTCRCGAVRLTLRNGRHVARGTWTVRQD